MFHLPEQYRQKDAGKWSSDSRFGNNGVCAIPNPYDSKRYMLVVCSDGGGWEHVSVSLPGANRCPTWEEMCYVKGLFWDEEDLVVQFHPPKSQYVNTHRHCLHLWRPIAQDIQLPDRSFVG